MIDYADHALLMNESYRHWTGEYLVTHDDPGDVLAALNQADFALLSYDLGAGAQFNYGNLQALDLSGQAHEDFLQLPSGDITPEGDGPAFAGQVEEAGWLKTLPGQWRAGDGRVFTVSSGDAWQLIDALGRVHGQALRFNDWALVDPG